MKERSKPLSPLQRQRVESAMGRVEALARAMAPQMSHISLDDLRSAGFEGLVEAAQRYDPASGIPFVGFAHHRARGAMIDAARQAAPAIRRRSRAMRTLEATQALLEQARARESSDPGLDPRTLRERVEAAAELVRQTTTAVIAAKAAPDDPDTVPQEGRTPEETLSNLQLRDHLRLAVAELPAADQELVEAIYDNGLTMGEYADVLGKSRSTVCRRHARILSQLGRQMRRGPPRAAPRDPDP